LPSSSSTQRAWPIIAARRSGVQSSCTHTHGQRMNGQQQAAHPLPGQQQGQQRRGTGCS
jgi:hypothetical protein